MMLSMEGFAMLKSRRKSALERSAGLSACVFEVPSLLGFLYTFLYTRS